MATGLSRGRIRPGTDRRAGHGDRRVVPLALLVLVPVVLAALATALAQGEGVELLRNPGFNEDADGNGMPDGWSTGPDTIRWREKAFMGKDYEIVSMPGQYVLATQDVSLNPGAKYTITLTLRGEDGALGGALIVHGEDKPRREMPLLWNVRPTEQYEEYVATFVAPNPVARLYIYNVARKGTIYYDHVSLREGEPDFPLIAEMSLKDIDRPLTEPPVTPHIAWASPLAGGPLKAFVTIRSLRELRDAVELAQRLELDYDLVDTGYYGTQAVSETGRRAQKRLRDGYYELYVIPSVLPAVMAQAIRERVEAGAGLVVLEGFGRAGQFLKPEELTEAGDDHYLRAGVPWDLMPEKILSSVQVGTLGKGRVVRLVFPLETSRVWGLMPSENSREAYRARRFEYWEEWQSLIARAAVWAAGREGAARLAVAEETPEELRLRADGAPAGSKASVVLRSTREIRFDGSLIRTGPAEQPLGDDGTLVVRRPEDFPAGPALADVVLQDREGRALDWGTFVIPGVQALRIEALAADKEAYTAEDEVKLAVKLWVLGRLAVTAEARLIDAFGRVTARVTERHEVGPVVAEMALSLPVREPLGVHHKAFVRVLALGREQDSAWVTVLVPETGPRLAAQDFLVTSWAPGGVHYPLAAMYAAKVRDLGLTSEFAVDPYLAAEHGMLAAGYMSPPGDVFRPSKRSEKGVRPACLSDPAVVEAYTAAARDAAAKQKPYGVYAVGITDEAFLTSRHQRDEVCFSDHCQRRYREWLKARYGDLEALNREWDTAYGSWDEVSGARTEDVRGKANFAPFVDFRTFMTDVWIDACRKITDAYHEVSPETPTGHTNTFGANPFNGNDYWKLCTQVGFGWGQEYSEAIKPLAHKAIFDLWRSFVETPQARRARAPDSDPARAQPFFNYGWIGYDHCVAAAHYEPWWLALHGSRGVSYFATNAMDPARGTSWALVYPTLSLTPYSQAVKDGLADLRAGCGKLFLEYQREEPQVALLWSHPSMLVAWCESTWDEPVPGENAGTDTYGAYFRSALNFRQHLNELQLDYLYLAPEQLAGAETARRYPVLYLPFTVAASAELIAALEEYVAAGGALIGDLRCLRTDEHGKPFPDSAHLERLFGVRRDGGAMDYGPTKVTFGATAPGLDLAGREVDLYAREALSAAGAEALASHQTGEPAVLLHSKGKGWTLYLNFLLPEYSEVTRELVRQVVAKAGVERTVVAENPAGGSPPRCYERNTFRRGPITVHAFLRDHRRCEDTDPVRFVLGETAQVYDMRAGRYLGRTDRVETALAPGDTALYACLPYRVAALRVSVPPTVEAGQRLELRAEVRAEGAEPGDHVFHLELVNPAGEAVWHYARNLLAPGGRLRMGLPLAINEQPGHWRARVRDVLTGETGETRFTVVGAQAP